ncbi:MAG: DUF2971 domain-containing protein [Sphingobacteriia bacterium]|nr:MAG: DUF2971 domain-containing protein [Sphingobacteriia bacterium]
MHWTSLSNLSSIINNEEIRLYNLLNSKDTEEFKYAAKLLALSSDEIDCFKQNYFTISFCAGENLNDEYLWKKYGRNYKGVAIKFSFTDNPDNWKNFFLSEVHYKLDDKFSAFQEEIKALKSKYNNNLNFKTDNWIFAGFFKKPKFKKENEIRLSWISPFTDHDDSLKYERRELKIEKGRNRIVSYLPLKLWNDPNSFLNKTGTTNTLNSETTLNTEVPQIKIDSIYFGKNCGLSPDEYNNMRLEILEMFQYGLGYSINLDEKLFG